MKTAAICLSLSATIFLSSPAGAQEPASLCETRVTCSDPRGCPDLVVDPNILRRDLMILKERFRDDDCSVIEGEVVAGRRKLLLFTSNTPNLGRGDLIIGDPALRPDLFEYSTCHGHPHFKEYSDYRLWTPTGYAAWQELRGQNPDACVPDLLAAHPEVASQMIAGHKQGFCIIDLYPSALPCPYPGPAEFVYDYCDTFEWDGVMYKGNQGLSVCWADEYEYNIPGQWIDVTGLKRGDYVLEVEVNPERQFEESNYTNNAAAVEVKIR
jgi:hypothetical protein